MAQGTAVDLEEVRALATPGPDGEMRSMASIATELGISVATVRRALVGDDGRPKRAPTKEKEMREAMDVLKVIRVQLLERGWAPSQRDIGEATGYTPSRINLLLQVLKHQGLIELGPGPREIRIVGSSMVIPEVMM